MKQLSTTALAKKRNIESKELFKILSNKKWIYKKDEKRNKKKLMDAEEKVQKITLDKDGNSTGAVTEIERK